MQILSCKFVFILFLSPSSIAILDFININTWSKQGNSLEWYPRMKFKVSSSDFFKRTAIIVEVNENMLKVQKKRLRGVLAADYWDFLPKDELVDQSCIKPNKRVLSHAQVAFLLCMQICVLYS